MKRILFVLLSALAIGAGAQDYPSKSITVIVPFAAGGPTDTLARNLGVTLTNTLKQQVVIDNSGGAGGTIGINKVAKARPDGYTLLLMHIGMATAPALYRKLQYDTMNDFEFIGQVADVPMTMLGKKTLQPNSLKELLPFIKANKDKLNYGNAGIGAASHLCGLLFMSQIEADLNTVSYKGTAPAMVDLMGGQIDLMCDQTTNTTPQIKAGTVKVFGVTSAQRIPSLKDIPTLAEQGMKGFEVVVWHGFYAPKGTPKPILDKLVAALQAAVQDAGFKSRLAELGAEPVPLSKANPESLRTHLQAEINKWDPVIKKAGIYAD
ncbi:MAG: tripartite tricarboxylate transporter substrate binding protein BugD [Betaproteobacteria bacterium]|nr:tripartite tricarboxylate transporter substrate binding protein BugD [Betaproteobacteria bacterium]